MLAGIFLNQHYKIFPYQIIFSNLVAKKYFLIRVFCKSDDVDDKVMLVILEDEGTPDYSLLLQEIEKNNLLSMISGKKVYLQVKESVSGKLENQKVLQLPFSGKKESFNFSGSILLNEMNLKNIYKIIGHPIDDLEDFLDNNYIRLLEKILFQKISKPPENFSDCILALSDSSLQLLLNHMLHKNIASTDMLASYIYGLERGGERIIENLSKPIRQEVVEKVKTAKLYSSYRWADEVKYIIHRNLYVAARELDIPVKGMEILDYMRRSYELSVVKAELEKKRVEDWLLLFEKMNQFQLILGEINRKTLTLALTFADFSRLENVFRKFMSKKGLEVLKEDIEFSKKSELDKRYFSLGSFYKSVKDLYYTPIVEKLDFEREVMSRLNSSDAVDLIVDEIGFAKVVYALKNMPGEWIQTVLSGSIKNIYEDAHSGKIKIKNYGDYRIEECRKAFLKALLILSDEEKI